MIGNAATWHRLRMGLFALICIGAEAGVAAAAAAQTSPVQPILEVRSKKIISVGRYRFRDLNGNGRLDPYEDWRLPANRRAGDLVKRMTLEEKAGMMLIATNNPDCNGVLSERGLNLIEQQKMTRFILRAMVTDTAPDCSVSIGPVSVRRSYAQTPQQMAHFTNAVQARLESTRLGIPGLFKSNARNHVEVDPMFGISSGAGVMTEFPKEAGLAAAALGAGAPVGQDGALPTNLRGDMSVIKGFAGVMGQEWRAIGLRSMYGYMADLTTEPRWSRAHETFTEDADLMTDIVKTLVQGLQGPVDASGRSLTPDSAVALTIKHFPGGGPQEMGLDPHYSFGKYQVYLDRTGKYGFGYHLKPFMAAIDGGVSAIMPYYGVPIGLTYQGVKYDEVGMAFSKQIVTDLLRDKLGFKGYVNSDSGVIERRSWGLESFRINPATGKAYTVADRTANAIRGGIDVLSEFSVNKTITDLVKTGLLDEHQHLDRAVQRLLIEQFQLGLFENPYVDERAAAGLIGTPASRELGMDIQRRSVVLLKNDHRLLPLKSAARVYVMGFAPSDVARYGYVVTDGNGKNRVPVPAGTDAVLIKVMVDNTGASAYASNDAKTGGRSVNPQFGLIDPRTHQLQATWGAQDPCVYDPDNAPNVDGEGPCLDSGLRFGGGFPWEVNMLALSDIAKAESWKMTPALADIQNAMREVGDSGKVVISIYFRNPYVLDDASGVKQAGALLATFGVSDAAQLDVISGKAAPRGRLPVALPGTTQAVIEQNPDAPGYAETKDGALYPFGFGLGY